MPEKKSRPRAKNLIGAQVRKARFAHVPQLTQDQLSAKLAAKGVSLDRAGVAKIENGLRGVSDFELVALAEVLGVEITALLNRQPQIRSQK